MTTRLPRGGRAIDRGQPVAFTFDGAQMRGFRGDTVASALLGAGQLLMGRSFKYHRPRSVVAAGPEEPNALIGVGEGARFTPNVRATVQPVAEGLATRSQNAWPSLAFDVGRVNDFASPVFPAGFYYKTFLAPRAAWKHVFEPFIRKAAGLGAAPEAADADRYEQAYAHCDVLVAGGGIAGLAAARAAVARGARVIVFEQSPRWGGRAATDGAVIEGRPADEWVAEAVAELEAAGATLKLNAQVAGLYDHGYVLGAESLGADGTRERLWRIRAGQVIAAQGAIERPLAFAGNDVPGVMLAGAVRDYVDLYGVSPGDRTVVVANNDDAYRTVITLIEAGLTVPAVLDARAHPEGKLVSRVKEMGVKVHAGRGVVKVLGRDRVRGVAVGLIDGEGAVLQEIACDCVAMSGGWSPAVHLWSHVGGKLVWDDAKAMFVPDPARPPLGADGRGFVVTAGTASGAMTTAEALADAHAAGGGEGAAPTADAEGGYAIEPVWMMPRGAPHKLRSKAWLDYQNDVKVSDVRLAAQEGFESVEHTKRYTTLGMATDQGKLSNINGLAILADALGAPIPQVGTTTFRPPWTPVTIGALAGEARGDLFQPLRRTPLHDWHAAHGAHWEPVGHWRRPYCYLRDGETPEQAVQREVLATRGGLGLLDASTLGKIVVRGPDAGRFVDMLYTNKMSTLPVGRCRYGLMCDENGFLIDDGVAARLDEQTWLCHTTTGGADRIHGWMEDWLQCEWWDWKVHAVNLTEQFAQVAVVGPNARTVLERLGGMDLSQDALPFMHWAEGEIAGIPARVFRISFSGELSYEVAVPASRGLELWEALHREGADLGATPYGTECLHVMRAEKGFIMIGDETDGTVIPQDLNLDWAISKKKDDFLGKRGQTRTHLADPERWKLVGLRTTDGSVIEDGAYVIDEGRNANGQGNVQGRVTSTYHSPTLGHGIAMGLLRGGPSRKGDTVRLTRIGKDPVEARVVDPVFYDPEGERLNG